MPVAELDPSVVQAVAEAQETPARTALMVSAGTGTGCPVQVLPFHLVLNGDEDHPVGWSPTARQSPDTGHDTDLSSVSGAAGTACKVQLDPPNSAATGSSCVPVGSGADPTATHGVLDAHDTLVRPLLKKLEDTVCGDHAEPFQ